VHSVLGRTLPVVAESSSPLDRVWMEHNNLVRVARNDLMSTAALVQQLAPHRKLVMTAEDIHLTSRAQQLAKISAAAFMSELLSS